MQFCNGKKLLSRFRSQLAIVLCLSFSVIHPRVHFFSWEWFLVDLNFNLRNLGTTMKRKNRNRFVDYDEFEVVDILLQIPHIIFEFESRLPLTWGFRRKRSAIDPSLSLAPTCANVSSPTTPLSFFPSESDGKCKRTKVSYKKV